MKSNQFLSIAIFGIGLTLLPFTASAQDSGKLLSSSGKVMMKVDAQAQPVEIRKGDAVPTGATLITSSNTFVLVGLAPGAAAIIEPNTTLTVGKNKTERNGDKIQDRTVDLSMDSSTGGVVSLLKQRDDSPLSFQIRTPTGVAAARGTIYRVTGSAFQVLEGDVVVTIGGQQYNLGPLQKTDGSGLIVDLTDAELEYMTNLIAQAGGSSGTGESGIPLFDLDLNSEANQGNPANGTDNNPEERIEEIEKGECEYYESFEGGFFEGPSQLELPPCEEGHFPEV